MSESTYYVFGMKSKANQYQVDMISVSKTYLVNLENAKIMKATLEESGDYEKVNFYFSSQFTETKKQQILKRITEQMQPLEFSKPFVVVDNKNGLWNMYSSKEAAQNTVIDKNKSEQDYKSDFEKQPFKIITWSEYNAAEKEKYVTAPIQISEERYYDLFECLPPKNWHTTSEALNVFFMSEFQTGSYTEQLIKYDDKFYSKSVDYCDKKTWCTKADLLEVIKCEVS